MSLTHLEIDEDMLTTAKRLGGHRTKTAAVSQALKEYNRRLSRSSAYDQYFQLAQTWDLEGAEAEHEADKSEHGR